MFIVMTLYVQLNSSIADTIGNQHFVPCSEVSLTQELIFLVGVALHNRANVATFSELSLAVCLQGRQSSTISNSASLVSSC